MSLLFTSLVFEQLCPLVLPFCKNSEVPSLENGEASNVKLDAFVSDVIR